jgi:hypothetical protein
MHQPEPSHLQMGSSMEPITSRTAQARMRRSLRPLHLRAPPQLSTGTLALPHLPQSTGSSMASKPTAQLQLISKHIMPWLARCTLPTSLPTMSLLLALMLRSTAQPRHITSMALLQPSLMVQATLVFKATRRPLIVPMSMPCSSHNSKCITSTSSKRCMRSVNCLRVRARHSMAMAMAMQQLTAHTLSTPPTQAPPYISKAWTQARMRIGMRLRLPPDLRMRISVAMHITRIHTQGIISANSSTTSSSSSRSTTSASNISIPMRSKISKHMHRRVGRVPVELLVMARRRHGALRQATGKW